MTSVLRFRKRVIFRGLWQAALIAGVLAALGNLLLLVIAGLFGISILTPVPPEGTTIAPLTAGPVVVSSVVPALAAALLLGLLGRFTASPLRAFHVIAVLFLLVSFAGPLGLPVDATSKLLLNLMHIIAAAAIVGVLSTRVRIIDTRSA
jgi:hypothetical protein